MAYTTINKSTAHFNTLLYTATGTQSVTGAGFQPDMSWVKPRSSTGSHYIADAVRGATKTISPNSTSAEGTQNLFTSFDSDGVSLGSDNWSDNRTAVIWNWKAGGGQGSSNTDGSINTTYTSVNTTAGFSISSYTGTGSANSTVGHGLGVAPSMIIVKKLNGSFNWGIYHKSLTAHKIMFFTTGTPDDDASYWNDVEPTSSVFNLGSGALTNGSGSTMIAYCFAEKTGYSKFGSYTGNGNADGTFVYTGFKPAFLLIKRTDTTKNWFLHDNKRLGYNPKNEYLHPNLNAAETTSTEVDILSNGFKFNSSGSGHNGSGGTYVYMAIGQSLVGSNNIPCTAR